MNDLTSALLDEDDLALRNGVRVVVEQVVAPAAAEVDRTGEFPRESVEALAELGALGLCVPTALGGAGASTLQYVLVIEEIARGCAATAAVVMTQCHAALPLLVAGTAEQRQRWLPALADGSTIGAIAFTEPEAGSDLAALRSRVSWPTTKDSSREATGRLSGVKMFITNGAQAGVVNVLVRERDDTGSSGLSMYLVDAGANGFTKGSPLRKMGLRGSQTVELAFDGVAVAKSQRVGAVGDGWAVAMATLDRARLSTAAQAIGIAQAAYERALAYARERRQFGRPVYEFQAVQFRLADMAMRIEQARALLHRVAEAVDSSDVASWRGHASMVKVVCSDAAMAVTTDAVQTLGGYGYIEDFGVERLMRDAKITQIYDGTNDINRLVVARSL